MSEQTCEEENANNPVTITFLLLLNRKTCLVLSCWATLLNPDKSLASCFPMLLLNTWTLQMDGEWEQKAQKGPERGPFPH